MICPHCGFENHSKAAFCKECGTQVRGEKIDIDDVNRKYYVQTLVLFLIIILTISFSFISEFPTLKHESIFSGLIIITTLVFAILDFKGFSTLFRFKFYIKPVLLLPAIAIILAISVSFFGLVIDSLGTFKSTNYYETFAAVTDRPIFYGIIFVSLIPGIFEEFLFRGILFNHLSRLSNVKTAIIITGILFAFVHFAFISLIWLLPFGIFLGYLRYKYNSIFYGMFFHALYNALIFFIEYIFSENYFKFAI
jgi:membrane protease YdiL (CAAX protease family)